MALLEETRDLLSSSNFAIVLERSLDRATSLLFDGLTQNVFVGEEEEGEVRLRTASVLPGLARWSSLALNGLPNELIDVRSSLLLITFILGALHADLVMQCLTDLHEMASFSAIIYSDYGDHFW